jgi:uncharacterized protein DUF4340
MSYKTTIIIAVLLALLGAYAYFYEYKGGEKKEQAKEKEKTLIEIKKEDVTGIQVHTDKGDSIVITSSGKDAWQITKPLQTRADESTVDRILSAFENLKYKEIIEEKPSDLAQYELKPPHQTIQLQTKKGDKKVLIGAKNPVDNVYYIQVNNDPRVYLAESGISDVATTSLQDLRDKKLTDFSADKVQSLSLKTDKLDLQFQRQNGIWKMVKPMESPASDTEVTSLLSSLESLRATRFVDQPSSDLSQYGFNAPLATVELSLEKGLHQKILFGKSGEETYAQIEGSPSIAAVGDSLNATFDKKLEDWREKKVFLFNRFDVDEFQVKLGTQIYTFKKGESDKWNELSPAKGEVEFDPIQNILEKLETAEISRFGDQSALSGPAVAEVFVTMKDWQDKITKKHFTFGPAADNLQQVKNDDYATIVFTQASLLTEIQKALSEIKPTAAAPAKKK